MFEENPAGQFIPECGVEKDTFYTPHSKHTG